MNFPPSFEERVKSDPFLGESLLHALNTPSPVSVRLNPFKTKPDLDFQKEISWCENAFYLKERPSFTLDPLFHAGTYYPQEAGSMILDTVLRQLNLPAPSTILDLCAAPGGKSTLIASFLNNQGLLVSNEVIQARSRILKENLSKWGCTNTIVTNNDPRDFSRLKGFFDVLVVDAPCSGEGMFRKDPECRNEWSENNVQLCSARQKRIVGDVWPALKSGGYLIYSTCTFNQEENEENVKFMLEEFDAELIFVKLPSPIRPGRENIGYYCIPGIIETEGFYIAVLQKKGTDSAKIKLESKKDIRQFTVGHNTDIMNLTKTDGFRFYQWNNLILAFPETVADKMMHVVAQMHIVKAGTTIGELSRKGIIPHEELALNPELNAYKDRIELTKDQALSYLHGDTFHLEGTQGFKLLTYQNEPLGWIKHLGNRFNNLYPKEWRIRMRI